jgi:signal peptidase I
VAAWIGAHRRALRAANLALTIVLGVVWFQLYRPQLVGGPAAYAVVEGTSMDGTLSAGDLLVTREHDRYHLGEIVAFHAPGGIAVIHRIVGGDPATGYLTRGDNRDEADPWRIFPRDIIGSVAVRVPAVGALVLLLGKPPMLIWLLGSIVLSSLWWLDRRLGRRPVPLLSSMVRPDHQAGEQ